MHNLWIKTIPLATSAAETKPPKTLGICFNLPYLPPAMLYSVSQIVSAFNAHQQFVSVSQLRQSYALPYCCKVFNY